MSNPPPLARFSIRDCAFKHADEAMFLLGHDASDEQELAHSAACYWYRPDGWVSETFDWTAHSLCAAPSSDAAFIAISMEGRVAVLRPGAHTEAEIRPQSGRRGVLRSVTRIGNHVVAAGTAGSVWRMITPDQWIRLTPNVPDAIRFEHIAGSSLEDLHAVGWLGAIWYFDEGQWRNADSPTNVILNRACVLPDGQLIVCGQEGVLLRGRHAQWSIIDQRVTTETFWDVCCFGERVFLTTASVLYELLDDQLVPVRFGEDPPLTFYRLCAVEGVLWSVGAKDVMWFESRGWQRLLP